MNHARMVVRGKNELLYGGVPDYLVRWWSCVVNYGGMRKHWLQYGDVATWWSYAGKRSGVRVMEMLTFCVFASVKMNDIIT